MVLEKLHLCNFRNFQDEYLYFPQKKIVRIFGVNGAGKTNLLEAIYILFTTKSFRNRKSLKECIKIDGNTFFHLSADFDGIHHGMTFSGESIEKSFFIAQQKVKSLDFIQKKSIVHFSPEESHLFFQSHEFRRLLLDRYISALDSKFLEELLLYNNLRSRKVQVIFSKSKQKKPLLMLETPQFVELSRSISDRRISFLEGIRPLFHHNISILNKKLCNTQLVYRKKNFSEGFLDKEIMAERVLFGCHKDELEIQEHGKDIRQFFSNGEKKAINLAFHFSFMEYLKECLQLNCLFCLDDIESELDKNTLENIQGIIESSSSQFVISSKLIEQADKSDFILQDGKILLP